MYTKVPHDTSKGVQAQTSQNGCTILEGGFNVMEDHDCYKMTARELGHMVQQQSTVKKVVLS